MTTFEVSISEVDVPPLPLSRLLPVIGSDRLAALEDKAAVVAASLGNRTIWNVNSTATGGGVAEMLLVLVGYAKGAALDVRWAVIEGDPAFFAITKRIHNRIHGMPGDRGQLGEREAAHYREVTAANAAALVERVQRGDVVVLHDPQTAGMARHVADAGAHVVWRCHIGADHANEHTEAAWAVLRPHLEHAEAVVFSRQEYVPPWVTPARAVVIPPSIDPFSPKNHDLSAEEVASLVGQAAPSLVDLHAPLVVQVSRWDRLKDMAGVMTGFASVTAPASDAHLALVGPDVRRVLDDPEGAEVLAECEAARKALPASVRQRVHLVTLPMDDVARNALMVNALQRSATVIVQKSLAEGFGLTVAEGMWKRRPVVGSAVGGIVDQLVPGTGVLLDDPADLDAFGHALADLLGRPEEIERLGHTAQEHVRDHFVGDRHLLHYAELFCRLCT